MEKVLLINGNEKDIESYIEKSKECNLECETYDSPLHVFCSTEAETAISSYAYEEDDKTVYEYKDKLTNALMNNSTSFIDDQYCYALLREVMQKEKEE